MTRLEFGPKHLTKTRATNELIFAGALWGFGFVATCWALVDFTPAETLLYRFLIAFGVGEFFRLTITRKSFSLPKSKELYIALISGLILGSMLLVQTIGLSYTTATKSGFITTLYVILVPIIQHLIFKIKTTWLFYFYVVIALTGTWLLVGGDISDLNQGDLWTLLCSVIAAAHILYVGYASPQIEDSFRFNNFQSLGCLALIIPFCLTQNHINTSATPLAWGGIIFLGVGSSIIAFLIQIRSQKILPPTTASMLFLLESPFAFIFGWLLLNESLSLISMFGGFLILLSSLLTIRLEQT